jgi:hypothetical protein
MRRTTRSAFGPIYITDFAPARRTGCVRKQIGTTNPRTSCTGMEVFRYCGQSRRDDGCV